MVGLTDIIIVTLLAIGSTVLIGVLGYLIDKNSEPEAEAREHGTDKTADLGASR